MQPRQNSMVWMAWCMSTSDRTNWGVRGSEGPAGLAATTAHSHAREDHTHLGLLLVPRAPCFLLIRAPAGHGGVGGVQNPGLVLILGVGSRQHQQAPATQEAKRQPGRGGQTSPQPSCPPAPSLYQRAASGPRRAAAVLPA